MKTHAILFQQNMGLRNHYYHFFYGIYLPVCEFLVSRPRDERFVLEVETCGEMDKHLHNNPLAPKGCAVLARHRSEMRWRQTRYGIDARFRAMDAFFLDTDDSILPGFVNRDIDTPTGRTILIDRIQPGFGQYGGQSYGASRRSLANIDDVSSAVGVSAIALDNLSINHQAELFWSADTVIAQHGASLANLYFCRPGTKVIEIGAGRRRCYNALCALRGLRHVQIDSWPRSEGKCFVDPEKIVEAMRHNVAPQGLPSDEISARLPDTGEWAEIGVLDGVNAARVLRKKAATKAHLVDLWQESPHGSRYRKSGDSAARMTQSQCEAAMRRAITRTRKYDARIVRRSSVQASADFRDQSLDLVYIDADHTFDGVSSDISAWWPKVKTGGWIGGHDYGVASRRWGVKKAVDSFASSNKVLVELGFGNTWFCKKQ